MGDSELVHSKLVWTMVGATIVVAGRCCCSAVCTSMAVGLWAPKHASPSAGLSAHAPALHPQTNWLVLLQILLLIRCSWHLQVPLDAVFRLGATLKPAWNAAVRDHRYQVWRCPHTLAAIEAAPDCRSDKQAVTAFHA
jgi:hypothetical protein